MSFGLLSDVMAGRPLVMINMTGAINAVLFFISQKTQFLLDKGGFALAVGGAMDEIHDPIYHDVATDCMDIYWGNGHWPGFNAANIAIAIVALLNIASSSVHSRANKEPIEKYALTPSGKKQDMKVLLEPTKLVLSKTRA